VLTCHSGPLQDLFRVYPKAEKTFRNIIRAANLEKGITAPVFQFKKERILILHHLLTSTNGLDRRQIRTLADAVLIRGDMPTIMRLLKVVAKGDKNGASGIFVLASAAKERFMTSIGRQSPKISKEEALWREAYNFASLVSDYDFLKQLKTATLDECLRDPAVQAEEAAYACLRTQVDSLVDGFGQQILSMQKGECDRQIQREINSEEERELRSLHAGFVSQIEDLTRQRSRSYVLCQCILK
jgi:hypothetical protein